MEAEIVAAGIWVEIHGNSELSGSVVRTFDDLSLEISKTHFFKSRSNKGLIKSHVFGQAHVWVGWVSNRVLEVHLKVFKINYSYFSFIFLNTIILINSLEKV